MTECEDPQLIFDLTITGQKGPGRSCSVRVITLDDSATGKCFLNSPQHDKSTECKGRQDIKAFSSEFHQQLNKYIIATTPWVLQ